MFKFKQEITGKIANNGTKDVEMTITLKHLSNFWRTLEVPLLVNFTLTWSEKCVLSNDAKATSFAITGTNISVVTLSNCLISNLIN